MRQLTWSIWNFSVPNPHYIFMCSPQATYMYPGKKSGLHITIPSFTLRHFIWFLSYDMKKVGLCVLATYAMLWFFYFRMLITSSICWWGKCWTPKPLKNRGFIAPHIGPLLLHRHVFRKILSNEIIVTAQQKNCCALF